ncbi:MAG: acetyl-CoA synthetase [Promethearchaeota archaeon]|nr:MAG: acetyl-CoA synthetase [Candidatus Lokiarchaeota archaeon]
MKPMSNLDFFFNPKSVAIIGASDTVRFGFATTKFLLNSKFKTYPVHLNKTEVLGHRAYKNVKDIPDEIELAIILVGSEHVPQTIRDCIDKGVKGIIIESAGFAETGNKKYIELQERVKQMIKTSNIRAIGPNCVGVTDFHNKFTTADVNFKRAIGGSISIIAQSGVLGNVFIDWGNAQFIGFSKSITLGNKIDIDEVDILEYLNKDPHTRIITLYLEGTNRGKEFIDVLKNMSKPVLVLKNGRTEIGSRAVISHTSSIAGNDKMYDAVFKQNPMIFRVYDFYEMFNMAHIFASQPLLKGKNIAIITASGSLGILACDELVDKGLVLAELKQETKQKIRDIIPDYVSIKGTIDLGPAMFGTLSGTLEVIFDDENVDALIFIFAVPRWPLEQFNFSMAPHFRLMKKLSKKYGKPTVCVCFGSRWVFEYINNSAFKFGIPVIDRIEHAVNAFKMMYEYNFTVNSLQRNE